MNKEVIDSISKLLSVALDLLFLKNPQRSSLGILLGLILQTLSSIFEPALKQNQWLDISSIQWYQFWIIGLGVMYLPMIVKYLFRAGNLNEDVDLALTIIEKAEKAGLSKQATRQLYIELSQTVLKNTVLKEQVKKEIATSEEEQPIKKVT